MRDKKGTLPLVANMIIGLVILGAGTMFVTSDIGQPYFEALNNFMFPAMTAGCDTNSVNSIIALAYALNCTGMHHAGIDVTDICPPQKLFGSKIAVCYGEYEDYNCEVQGFELTKDPDYDESDPDGWIAGMGDPNCLVYYEAFPEEQAADWKVRVEDWNIIGIAIGGTMNMIPGFGKLGNAAAKSVIKNSIKGTINVILKRQIIYNTLKKSISKAALKESKELLVKKFMQTSKASTNMVKYLVRGRTPTTALSEANTQLVNEFITKNTFKYVIKEADAIAISQIRKEMLEEFEKDIPGLLTKNEKELVIKEIDSYVNVIKPQKSAMKQITELGNMRRMNIYGDLMLNQGTQFTRATMKTQIKKSANILKNIPKNQKEMLLTNARKLSSGYMSPKMLTKTPVQLWAIDMATENLPEDFVDEDNADAINALSSCGAMLGVSGGTLVCAFVTSVGVMAAYIDNDNEKYNPVGINSLGYKRNYYDVQSEKLDDILNYYYIALKRDDFQTNKRFFLASPCKTEKVVVKHEIMSCYYRECKNNYVCCEKKVKDMSGTWIPFELAWELEDQCITSGEALTSATLHNSFEFLKVGVLVGALTVASPVAVLGTSAVVAYFDEVNVIDPNTGELSPNINIGGHEFKLFNGIEGVREMDSYDDEVLEQDCVDAGQGPKPADGICKGAYFKEGQYYGLNNPIIKTVANDFVNTYPEKYPNWNSKIEIETPINYYYYNDAATGPIVNEVLAMEHNIQFETIENYNSGFTTNLKPAGLMMDASGNGIKQCTQVFDKLLDGFNPWREKTKENIEALTVNVELDKTFEGTNYCYASLAWKEGILKTGAMLTVVAIDILVAAPTGGLAAPAIMFATGAAYEMFAHVVDKKNAWPNR